MTAPKAPVVVVGAAGTAPSLATLARNATAVVKSATLRARVPKLPAMLGMAVEVEATVRLVAEAKLGAPFFILFSTPINRQLATHVVA